MTEEQPLLAAEGRLSELDILVLTEESVPGVTKGAHADLTMPFRAASQISIGDLIVEEVVPGDDAAPEVRAQTAEYEFYQVQLVCSFAAAAGCRFTDARFGVTLTTRWEASRGQAREAIAYDLFPVLVEDPQTVTVTSAVQPEVSFGYDPVSAKLSLPSRKKESRQVRYASRIAAFDLRGTRPGWTFYRTDQHEINGPQRLYMLVRKPKGGSVAATFSLAGRVQFVIGGRGLAPAELVMMFRPRNREGLVTDSPEFPLC